MQINTNFNNTFYNNNNSLGIENVYTQKLTKEETDNLKEQIEANKYAFTFKDLNSTYSKDYSQMSNAEKFQKDFDEYQSFLRDSGLIKVNLYT